MVFCFLFTTRAPDSPQVCREFAGEDGFQPPGRIKRTEVQGAPDEEHGRFPVIVFAAQQLFAGGDERSGAG
jgi:hypothetical protein